MKLFWNSIKFNYAEFKDVLQSFVIPFLRALKNGSNVVNQNDEYIAYQLIGKIAMHETQTNGASSKGVFCCC